MQMLIINVIALVTGTAIGCLIRKRIPGKLQENAMIYLAVMTLALGIRLVMRAANFSPVVIAFLIGGTLGHFLKIDSRIYELPNKFAKNGAGTDISVLMTCATLYCFSTSGILGAMELGFSGDTTLLTTKAVMDFVAGIFFAAAGAGWGQAIVSVPMAVILISFYLLSRFMMPYLTPGMIDDFSACGGLILITNALRMMKLNDPPVLDLVPAMFAIFIVSGVWERLL